MSPEEAREYKELESQASSLREDADQIRMQLEQLQKEKDVYNKDIAGSQVKNKSSICTHRYCIY